MNKLIFIVFFAFSVIGNVNAQKLHKIQFKHNYSVEFQPLNNTPKKILPEIEIQKALVTDLKPVPEKLYRFDSTLVEISEKRISLRDLPKPKKVKFVFTATFLSKIKTEPAPKFVFKDIALENIKYLDKSHGFFSNNVSEMAQDADGTIWFSSFDSGLCRLDGLQMKTYTTVTELVSSEISSLLIDSENRLWIGTSNGVCYIVAPAKKRKPFCKA